jgi:hypothetical protein
LALKSSFDAPFVDLWCEINCLWIKEGFEGSQCDHLGDPGVDGSIILKWIFKKWDGGMDWIELVQDRDRWQAAVNAMMSLRFP